MKLFYRGQKVNVKIRRENFVSKYGFPRNFTDTLVRYDKDDDAVIVDCRCDLFYEQYAGLHEAICCGKYQHLAPEAADPLDRCGLIDLSLLENMDNAMRRLYLTKRIEMFRTLIDGNFNSGLNEQFKRSLEILETKMKEMG